MPWGWKNSKEKKSHQEKTESSAGNCLHTILWLQMTQAGDASRGKIKVLPPGANDPPGNTRQPESPYWWAGEWGEKVESRIMSQWYTEHFAYTNIPLKVLFSLLRWRNWDSKRPGDLLRSTWWWASGWKTQIQATFLLQSLHSSRPHLSLTYNSAISWLAVWPFSDRLTSLNLNSLISKMEIVLRIISEMRWFIQVLRVSCLEWCWFTESP